MSDLISREDAMGAVQDHFNADGFRGYDDGQKMMDRIKALPSAETHEIRTETHGVCSDLISRADAINQAQDGVVVKTQDTSIHLCKTRVVTVDRINELPSAEAVPQSDQYKKGFEDAKRAFELEFAREAESILKQNAQLEVMLNIQKALLAERNWIPCSERLPSVYGEYLATVDGETIEVTYVPETKGLVKGWSTCDAYGYKGLSDDDVIAWRPKPKPYKESEVEE